MNPSIPLHPAPQVTPLWQAIYHQVAHLTPARAHHLAQWQAALRAVRVESS